jgi:hypothetical protein
MLRLTGIHLPLDHAPDAIAGAAAARLRIAPDRLISCTVSRRANDARKKAAILLVYSLDVEVKDEAEVLKRFANDIHVRPVPDTGYRFVGHATTTASPRPLVIGAGPCGLFAALLLAQMGFRPIILERGKVVRDRTKDTWGFWRKSVLKPESNVQYGEGGAGTFSDGKLYSQIKDPRHLGRKVLTEFVKAGAPPEILIEAHPHIGTFRLVKMVENMRATIQDLGGEYRFESRVTDLDIETAPDGTPDGTPDGALGGARQIRGVVLASGEHIASNHVVLAIGHSSRDTFQMLHDRGVHIEAKPFSVGFRIEHPQSLIDKARFGRSAGNPILGAAEYKLVHHASNGRDVYSFCMCPGGTVVAAASEEGRVVTNGMSQYSRNERNANAGIVVGISPEKDYPGGPLAGVAFQRQWESAAFLAGGGTYAAPAQRVGDFLARRPSTTLGGIVPSYKPGVTPTDLTPCLPDFAITAIREAIPAFAQRIRGYDMDDALLTGVETRTSSPIRIRRDDSLQSINTRGLFPAGEGAGYAGGILSAGVDGIRIAEAVAQSALAK